MRGINLVLFAMLLGSLLMSACATTRTVAGPPSVAAAPDPGSQAAAAPVKGTVLKGTKLVQPVDVRVGSAVESRDPLRIEKIDGAGTVVAPVQVDVTVPAPEPSYWKYGAVIVGSAAVIGLGLLAADQAGVFDSTTTLVGARPAR